MTTLVVLKGTTVWVGKDLSSESVTLFRHTMKQDMMIAYPTTDAATGPKVIALARNVETIGEPKLTMLKLFVRFNTPGPTHAASLFELLQHGFDLFVTDHKTYPLLIVHSMNVDEADDDVTAEFLRSVLDDATFPS